MVWMPQLLYFLHNSPICIPQSIFQRVNSLFLGLIWKGGVARLRLEVLQYPKRGGGLAFMDIFPCGAAAALCGVGTCGDAGSYSQYACHTLQGVLLSDGPGRWSDWG